MEFIDLRDDEERELQARGRSPLESGEDESFAQLVFLLQWFIKAEIALASNNGGLSQLESFRGNVKPEMEEELERDIVRHKRAIQEAQALLPTLKARLLEEFQTSVDTEEEAESAIRRIGEDLGANGGELRMRRIAYRVKGLGGSTRSIESSWSGIRGWSA